MAKGKSRRSKISSFYVLHGADEPETARTQDEPNVNTLIDQITPKAKGKSKSKADICHVTSLMKGMMDAQTKAAVLQEIEAVLEREVEKA